MRNHTGFTRPALRLLRVCPWGATHLPVRLWPSYPPRSWRAVTRDFAIPPVPIPDPLTRTLWGSDGAPYFSLRYDPPCGWPQPRD